MNRGLFRQGFADLCLTTWRPRHRIRKESSPQALALAIRFFPGKIVKTCVGAGL
jgi:hypothetical protein